jgi:hypothetical protein
MRRQRSPKASIPPRAYRLLKAPVGGALFKMCRARSRPAVTRAFFMRTSASGVGNSYNRATARHRAREDRSALSRTFSKMAIWRCAIRSVGRTTSRTRGPTSHANPRLRAKGTSLQRSRGRRFSSARRASPTITARHVSSTSARRAQSSVISPWR